MPKAQPLCTSELNLRQFEVTKKRIALLLCQDTAVSCLKNYVSQPEKLGEEFYGNGSRVGLLTRLGCVQGFKGDGESGNSGRFYFLGLRNHCRW